MLLLQSSTVIKHICQEAIVVVQHDRISYSCLQAAKILGFNLATHKQANSLLKKTTNESVTYYSCMSQKHAIA